MRPQPTPACFADIAYSKYMSREHTSHKLSAFPEDWIQVGQALYEEIEDIKRDSEQNRPDCEMKRSLCKSSGWSYSERRPLRRDALRKFIINSPVFPTVAEMLAHLSSIGLPTGPPTIATDLAALGVRNPRAHT